MIITSIIFVILAAVFILASNIFIKESFINSSKSIVGSAIQSEAKDLRPADFSLKDPVHAKAVFTDFYQKVRTTQIIRIKVWDYSGKVIFSDDESIIGKRFSDNESFQEAMKGEVVTEISQKVKPENISEQGYEQLLEVYVPIVFKSEQVPSGVIEAYFKLDEVNSHIKQTQIALLVAIVTFTLMSFGLLFVVFKMVIYKQVEKIRLQAVALDNASDHVIITDPDGIILYVNKAAEKLTGYSQGEMIGNRPSLWGNQMPKEFYEKMWKTIKVDKKDFEGQITNKRKNGEEYVAAATISPVLDKNSNVAFFVGIERDITKEKELDKAKSEFISLASHQLRTPLGIIKWYIEALKEDDLIRQNPQMAEDYLDEVYNSNERLIKLVADLLDVSRLDQSRVKNEPVSIDILEFIKTVIEQLEIEAAEKEIEITLTKTPGSLPKLNIDQERFREVLENLISNAVKYTDQSGQVEVTVNSDGNNLQVDVKDNGMGIAKADQPKIFTRFFRSSAAAKKDPSGAGLGLYIVQSYIEGWGGKVWFESIEGKGTTFHFSLPLRINT